MGPTQHLMRQKPSQDGQHKNWVPALTGATMAHLGALASQEIREGQG